MRCRQLIRALPADPRHMEHVLLLGTHEETGRLVCAKPRSGVQYMTTASFKRYQWT